MTRALLLLLALVSLTAQQPQVDESNLPDSEKRIPAGHYCKREGVRITARETRAHSCACKFACEIDADGNVIEHEEPSCLAYCHAHGRRCTCHVEEPCQPKAGAFMDMDGQVVAEAVRR